MKIRFIKDHTSGLKEGNIKDVASSFAARMIEAGYAVEHTEEPADITPPSTEVLTVPEVLPPATEPEQPAAAKGKSKGKNKGK